ARGLADLGFQLLSTGGTLQALKDAGLSARKVSEHTGSPEILGGRVKTLHPRIHGGLLGRLALASDRAEMEAGGIAPISVLAVNLYPFRETVAKGVGEEEILENIDIGGPAMIRAGAKNAASVTVVVDPADYEPVLEELRRGGTSAETRRRLQRKAYSHTAAYDASIAGWMGERDEVTFPDELAVGALKVQELRYGENPHQRGAWYRSYREPPGPSVSFAEVLQGKELSYNNLLDLDAALALALEFPERPAASSSSTTLPAAWHRTRCWRRPTGSPAPWTRCQPSAASWRSTARWTSPAREPWPRPSSRQSSPPGTPRPRARCWRRRRTSASSTREGPGRPGRGRFPRWSSGASPEVSWCRTATPSSPPL